MGSDSTMLPNVCGCGLPMDGNRRRERARPMRHLCNCVRDFLNDEDGPTAVEYAVMLALIIIVAALAVSTVGTNSSENFNSQKLKNAMQAGS